MFLEFGGIMRSIIFIIVVDSYYYIQQKKTWKLFFKKAFHLLYYADTLCTTVDHVIYTQNEAAFSYALHL